LDGSGNAATWATRALARMGYGITEDINEARFSVAVEEHADGCRWTVRSDKELLFFPHLDRFCHWLETFAR